jgi:DNA-binding MurR/RpiR family transcriptional regulator
MVSTGVDYLDTSVNALAFAAQFIRSKQSKRQMQVSDRFILDPEMPQWQLADELKISRPTVSKILKYGGFDTLDEIRLAIQRILSTSIIDPNGAD